MQHQHFLQSTLWFALCLIPTSLSQAINGSKSRLELQFQYNKKKQCIQQVVKVPNPDPQSSTQENGKSTEAAKKGFEYFAISISLEETVALLKDKINEQVNDYSIKILLHNRKKLNNSNTLASYGITSFSKILGFLKKKKVSKRRFQPTILPALEQFKRSLDQQSNQKAKKDLFWNSIIIPQIMSKNHHTTQDEQYYSVFAQNCIVKMKEYHIEDTFKDQENNSPKKWLYELLKELEEYNFLLFYGYLRIELAIKTAIAKDILLEMIPFAYFLTSQKKKSILRLYKESIREFRKLQNQSIINQMKTFGDSGLASRLN